MGERGWLKAVLLALLLGLLGWAIWATRADRWRPAPTSVGAQGVAIGAANRPLTADALKAAGARFVYLDATRGSRLEPGFSELLAAARGSGLPTGAIHHYRLCAPAAEQAAAFVTLVPRASDTLPPLVLIEDEAQCARPPSPALLRAELTTFLSQVETHGGRRAVLGIMPDLEERYPLGDIRRERLLIAPRDAGAARNGARRDWALWLANDRTQLDGVAGRVRWLALRRNLGQDGRR